MNWFQRSLKRLAGGDRQGLDDAIREAVANRARPEVEDLAREFAVSPAIAALTLKMGRRAHFLEPLNEYYREGRFKMPRAREVAEALGLDSITRDETLIEFGRDKLQALVNEIMDDGMLTPDEDARLTAELGKLDGLDMDASTQNELGKAREVWRAQFGELRPVDAPVLLKRGEFCVHVVHAEASEIRSKTVRVSYGGPRARVRIMRGVYYTVGSTSVARHTEDYEHSFGQGALCITNQRLLWIGPQKSLTIPLQGIVRYDDYSNALCVYKGTGKPQMFRWNGNDRASTLMAIRAIEELR